MATKLSVSLDYSGRIVVGITAPCGCCEFNARLSDAEAQWVLESLTALIAVSQRVQRLPLPWIHDEGNA
jgi:hypothetical protein